SHVSQYEIKLFPGVSTYFITESLAQSPSPTAHTHTHTHKPLAHKMGHCYTERKRVDRIYNGNLVTTRCAKSPSNWRLPSGEGWVKNEEWLRLRDSQRPEERGGFSSAAPHTHTDM